MVIIYRGGEVNNRPPLATDTEVNNCYLVYTETEYNRVLEKKRNDKWKPKGNLLVFVMVPFFFPLNFGILRCLFIYLFLSDSYFVILIAKPIVFIHSSPEN